MADNKQDIAVLNTLIATTLDSMKGYRLAGEQSHSSNARFFLEMADQRSDVASALQSHVRTLGGDPEDDSSVMGSIHRQFTKLKDAIGSSDEKAIVDEVERGEDYIKNKYEEALSNGDIQPSTRAVIEQHFASIKVGHDKVSAMKHAHT